MCGICGFFKQNSKTAEITEKLLWDMNEKMIKRGPDGGSVWLQKANVCGLGHRRLSIVDLSVTATQPMKNKDESVVISFNGEIYNHREIRKELEALHKYEWITDHSDTEVILHSYEEWGMGCLEKFRGIFAIAIWDENKQIMTLVRDRIGVKPLYYTIQDGVLYFASEIKAILPALKRKCTINHKAMYDYLSFLTTPSEETLFDGIYKVRPGVFIEFDKRGNLVKNEYWDVWDHTRPDMYEANDEYITAKVIDELREAVRYRGEADVPVGVFLSGGIDSSTNAALFTETSTDRVKTFCIGYDQEYNSYKNETHYARQMAEYCGAEYFERLLDQEDLFSFLPEMVRLQDEPIADPVCVPVYYVSKLARDNGIIVAQVGEGSDELFWGYESWKLFLKLARLDKSVNIPFIKKMAYGGLKGIGKGPELYTELLRRASAKLPIFWSGAEAFYEYDKKRMISDSLKKELGDYTSFEAIRSTYNRYKDKAWEKSILNWMSYADLRHRLPELLLMRVDKMSMGVSLEARVPFLDHKFVELAMSIPEKKKTENDISKTVLKKAVRGIIPDELIDRKKQGFGVPINDWVSGRLGKEMKRESLQFASETELLDKKYLASIFDREGYGAKQWYLYNLALWWKEYIK